jgi:2-(1,2-epoxy-1,2-dihydrophenyl)acetyl-CoA isomerase
MDGTSGTAKVKTEIHGNIGVITLNDPATLNAAGQDRMVDLGRAFDGFVADPGVRAIVITGEGRGFCSGANLSAPPAAGPTPGPPNGPNMALINVYNPFTSAVRRSPKPLVAAVNGVAAGVGVSLALVCDLCVAAESAYFLLAFRRIGLVPDGGATYLLPRLIGKARAMELTLLGERLPAKTALEWGMINRCVPDADLMTTAMAMAKTLADGPAALSHIRNLIWASLDAAWHDQIEAEAYAQGEAARTEDAGEGRLAFVQKRPAQFKGR